jgi:hypothetical protein
MAWVNNAIPVATATAGGYVLGVARHYSKQRQLSISPTVPRIGAYTVGGASAGVAFSKYREGGEGIVHYGIIGGGFGLPVGVLVSCFMGGIKADQFIKAGALGLLAGGAVGAVYGKMKQ